jgi:predicted DNA-binding antitoxin AbrB/MazE fold protein
MAITIEAIFENGVLKPLSKLGLKEHKKYKVSLEEETQDSWLTEPLPEIGDIVFNEDPSLPLDKSDWPEDDE